ncbi:hypothetical protein [Lacinutrix chionoecetis]
MKSNINKYHIVSILLLFFSCNLDIAKNNEESERKKAELIVNVFYKNISDFDYDKNENLLSTGFKKNVDINAFNKAFDFYNERLGNYESKELYKWSTERSALENEWNVTLIYFVTYTKSKSFEKFDLVKEGEKIYINNYVINSKALETIPSE